MLDTLILPLCLSTQTIPLSPKIGFWIPLFVFKLSTRYPYFRPHFEYSMKYTLIGHTLIDHNACNSTYCLWRTAQAQLFSFSVPALVVFSTRERRESFLQPSCGLTLLERWRWSCCKPSKIELPEISKQTLCKIACVVHHHGSWRNGNERAPPINICFINWRLWPKILGDKQRSKAPCHTTMQKSPILNKNRPRAFWKGWKKAT